MIALSVYLFISKIQKLSKSLFPIVVTTDLYIDLLISIVVTLKLLQSDLKITQCATFGNRIACYLLKGQDVSHCVNCFASSQARLKWSRLRWWTIPGQEHWPQHGQSTQWCKQYGTQKTTTHSVNYWNIQIFSFRYSTVFAANRCFRQTQ